MIFYNSISVFSSSFFEESFNWYQTIGNSINGINIFHIVINTQCQVLFEIQCNTIIYATKLYIIAGINNIHKTKLIVGDNTNANQVNIFNNINNNVGNIIYQKNDFHDALAIDQYCTTGIKDNQAFFSQSFLLIRNSQ